MTKKPLLPAVCLPLALAACSAPPQWHKDGTDEMNVQRDLSACRQQAQAMYGVPGMSMGGSSPMSPRLGPVDPSPADRTMQEAQVVNSCMRGKGYVLRAADQKQ